MSLESFNDLNKTTWLTAWCHHDCGTDWGLKRPVSDWMIKQIGAPPFASDLSFFTRHGISARAAWIDARLTEALERTRDEPVEVWSIGAGLDSRWEYVLGGGYAHVTAYREFDHVAVLNGKNDLLSRSPWATLWGKVERHGGDILAGLPDSLPATDGAVLIVIEGLLDYLDRDGKNALFGAIRKRAPRARLLIDAQNRWLLDRNNKGAQQATGSDAVRFAWAPDDPQDFYGSAIGYKVTAHHQLLPDLMRRRWPLTSWLPLPRKVREAYTLFHLQPA